VTVGQRTWLAEDWAQSAPEALVAAADAAESQGRSPVWVGWDGAIRGIVVVADTVKVSSAEAISELRDLGIDGITLNLCANAHDPEMVTLAGEVADKALA